jgi:hypothetical protein
VKYFGGVVMYKKNIKKRLMAGIIISIMMFSFLFSANAYPEAHESDSSMYLSLQIGNRDFILNYAGYYWLETLDESDPSVMPILHEGRTMLPMRAVANIHNFDGPDYWDVKWVASENKAILGMCYYEDDDTFNFTPVAEFTINSSKAIFYDDDGNPRQVEIPGAAMLINNRTYLPLRAVSEAMGTDIEWVPSKQGIVIILFDERPESVRFPDGTTVDISG